MAQRILVFENNSQFVEELQAGFGRYGAEVDVVDSADAGLERAKAAQPDLVLLSVDAMPAPGEAFLLCKKFKSDDGLKGVPFVIMGGDSHADAFESHKKLKKRRADEYLRLPIGFDDLLQQVDSLVHFAIENDAEDDEIEAFTASAIGGMMIDEEAAAQQAATVTPGGTQPVASHAAAHIQVVSEVPASLPSRRSPPPPPPSSRPSSVTPDDRRIGELQEEVELLRKRLDTAKRVSMRPPGTGGVSNREHLELRESLHRKEKETLELRDQISARDKQLFDANERNLVLERGQADLDDRIAALGRDLNEANERIDALRADKESLGKRLDDSRGRLTRTQEKLDKAERDLEAGRAEFAQTLDSLRIEHDKALHEARDSHAAELESLTSSHTQQISALEERVASESATMRADHAAKLEEAEAQHAAALKAATDAHEQATVEAQRDHDELQDSLRAEHAAQQQAKDEAHATAQAELNEEFEQTSARLRADAAAAQEQALVEQKEALEKQAAEAQSAALSARTQELESAAAGQRKELEDRHGKELAVLGRKLSESDTKAAQLSEDLAQLGQAKQQSEAQLGEQIAGLEGDLATRTEERDSTQNELSAARDQVATLEGVKQDQEQRIGSLEKDLGDVQAQLARTVARMEADAELLARVRRALGIGIGLLEEQKNATVEGPEAR